MFSLNPRKSFGLVLVSALIAAPVAAHNVHVSGNVAATFHIEPGHNPQASRPSQAWFALTRKGGQPIPLSQCNCQLSVYSVPRTQNAQPLMRPPLRAIRADQYRDIPGAQIVFPKAGAYELELRGTAKNGGNFSPFMLKYTVNVVP